MSNDYKILDVTCSKNIPDFDELLFDFENNLDELDYIKSRQFERDVLNITREHNSLIAYTLKHGDEEIRMIFDNEYTYSRGYVCYKK